MLTATVAGVLAGTAVLLISRPHPSARLTAPGLARNSAGMVVRQRLRRAVRFGRAIRQPSWDVAGLAEQVAALSRAGLPWVRVWAVLARTPGGAQPVCAAVVSQVAAGGTAAEGLRSAAGPPSLWWFATACDIAERAGAPVADVLERFAAAVRADAAAAADRDAALAGPRATAAVLSWLPLGGIGLGLLIGADPLATLVGTGPGRLCLVAGVGLWTLGRWWLKRLVRRAEGAST